MKRIRPLRSDDLLAFNVLRAHLAWASMRRLRRRQLVAEIENLHADNYDRRRFLAELAAIESAETYDRN
ncbi:MAG: hypothetical protein Q7S02_06055 [bacterium]|nr:hypothetical protein [bacterium]